MATMYNAINNPSSNPRKLVSPNSHSTHSTSSKGVGFDENKKDAEYRSRILTVKYGGHQMKLIRKRLAIEDWLDKELRIMYRCESETDDYDTEIDIDEILDLDEIQEKREFVKEKVANAPQCPEVISKFIEEVLQKVATL